MYEAFYGFTEKPFLLTPDPHFFFASKMHTRALSYLRYGVGTGEGFIVISGDIGTGKTTIANNLLAELKEDDIFVIQIVTPKLNPEDLLMLTASKLGVDMDGENKGQLLKKIENQLVDFKNRGKRVLLLVDEAQNLPSESVEELRMLSNFMSDGKPLLQSFLLGQSELRDILKQPNMEQFRQRIVASCSLKPLSESETREYVEFRVNSASKEPRRLFSDEALSLIYQNTRGVPRKINTLTDRILLFGFLEEKEYIENQDVETVLEELLEESLDDGPQSVISQSAITSSMDEDTRAGYIALSDEILGDVTYIQNFIADIRRALDDSVKHKLRLSRMLDQMLEKKMDKVERRGK